MRLGLTNALATGNERSRPLFLSLMAEAPGKFGWIDEGLHLLAEAREVEVMDAIGRSDIEAEWCRLKGQLLL